MKLRRRELKDEYHEDGVAVVMVGTDVLVLSPVATALLVLVGEGEIDLEDAAKVLVKRFGPPPDDPTGRSVVQTAAEALAAQNLIELVD